LTAPNFTISWIRPGFPPPRLRLDFPTPTHGGKRLDLSLALVNLCETLCTHIPELYHIDPDRLILNIVRNRKRTVHGLQARITPLRFEDGNLTGERRGRTYQIQRYFLDGTELFYHLAFCVPRFFMLSFRERLITVVHELYHIAPQFHGGLRHFGGNCRHHGPSRKGFDAIMGELVDRFLKHPIHEKILAPFRWNLSQVRQQFDGIDGWAVPKPRLIPLGKLRSPHLGPMMIPDQGQMLSHLMAKEWEAMEEGNNHG